MNINARFEKLTLAFALGVPCAVSLGLMIWVPARMTTTTFAVVVALLLGTATVALNTWKSAQATGSVAQLLYETNTGVGLGVDDRAAVRNRLFAMTILSAATTAVILATWLA